MCTQKRAESFRKRSFRIKRRYERNKWPSYTSRVRERCSAAVIHVKIFGFRFSNLIENIHQEPVYVHRQSRLAGETTHYIYVCISDFFFFYQQLPHPTLYLRNTRVFIFFLWSLDRVYQLNFANLIIHYNVIHTLTNTYTRVKHIYI